MNVNIFREYDIRGIVGEHLTDETVASLGLAIGTFYGRNNAKRISAVSAWSRSGDFQYFQPRRLRRVSCR